MWSRALGALRGQGPDTAFKIKLVPPHGSRLFAAAAAQHQNAYIAAARFWNDIEGSPKEPQLLPRKNALPGSLHLTTPRARSGVCFNKLALDGVPE